MENEVAYEELVKLKKACYQYAKENFRGKSFYNYNRKAYINVSKSGLDEWYSKSKSLEQILSVTRLNLILENAIYTHSAKNKHENDRSGAFFDYFYCIVKFKEKTYKAVISIRNVPERTERKLIYYHHYLDDIKIEPSSTLSRQPDSRSGVVLLDGSLGEKIT